MSAFAEYLNNALAEAEDAGAAEAQLQAVGAETEAAETGLECAEARARDLVSDIVALRFDRTVADRNRPVLEAVNALDGIHDVRNRPLECAPAEELLSGLGLPDGHRPTAEGRWGKSGQKPQGPDGCQVIPVVALTPQPDRQARR